MAKSNDRLNRSYWCTLIETRIPNCATRTAAVATASHAYGSPRRSLAQHVRARRATPEPIPMLTVVIAQLLGYTLHPNYEGPAGTAAMTVLQAVGVWIGIGVMCFIFNGTKGGRLT